MTTRQKLNRELRKDSIIEWLNHAVRPYTIADIARGQGLVVTPYLRGLMNELESEGRVVTELLILWNGVEGKGYRIRNPHNPPTA